MLKCLWNETHTRFGVPKLVCDQNVLVFLLMFCYFVFDIFEIANTLFVYNK